MRLQEQEPRKLRIEANAYRVEKTREEVNKITASAHDLDILKKEDIKDNTNFLYFQAQLCNAGLINKNGHGLTIPDIVRIRNLWEHTYIDKEHNPDSIFGFIVKTALTDHNTKKELTDEEALNYKEPIDVSIGFLIWSNIDESISTLLQKIGAAEGEANELISLSLELSFKDLVIYKGKSKNMFEGELITDDSRVDVLYSSLKDFGGTGLDKDGIPIYMICTGEDLMPSGAGLVISPAANVSGISSKIKANLDEPDEEENDDDDSEHPDDCECDECLNENGTNDMSASITELELLKTNQLQMEETIKKLTEQLNNFVISGSQSKNSNVKASSMKINSINDINEETLKEIKACDITSFISEQIAQKSAEHTTALEAKTKEVTDAVEATRVAKEQFETVNANLTNLTKELNDLKEARAAEALIASFNDRMSALDEEFELDDSAREVIASQIKNLSDDEFVSWKKGFDVIAAAKNKAAIEASKKKEDKNIQASTEDNTDPLEALKAKIATIPSTAEISKDVIAKYKDAFSLEKGFTLTV